MSEEYGGEPERFVGPVRGDPNKLFDDARITGDERVVKCRGIRNDEGQKRENTRSCHDENATPRQLVSIEQVQEKVLEGSRASWCGAGTSDPAAAQALVHRPLRTSQQNTTNSGHVHQRVTYPVKLQDFRVHAQGHCEAHEETRHGEAAILYAQDRRPDTRSRDDQKGRQREDSRINPERVRNHIRHPEPRTIRQWDFPWHVRTACTDLGRRGTAQRRLV